MQQRQRIISGLSYDSVGSSDRSLTHAKLAHFRQFEVVWKKCQQGRERAPMTSVGYDTCVWLMISVLASAERSNVVQRVNQ